jgi:hypothetical protein
MIRIVIENIFFFLLPTFAYVAWVAFKTDEWPGLPAVLRAAPLLGLFAAGMALMLTTLIAFSFTSTGGKPGESYEPPSYKDGHVVPGHTLHDNK